MDFIMPEMNGLEAARHLTKRHPDVLILLITTDPSIQLEIEARRAGIKGVCAKSEMQCLVSAVEALMGGGTYFSGMPRLKFKMGLDIEVLRPLTADKAIAFGVVNHFTVPCSAVQSESKRASMA
jgi:DNA-binding NarL/FixJ family response regulator